MLMQIKNLQPNMGLEISQRFWFSKWRSCRKTSWCCSKKLLHEAIDAFYKCSIKRIVKRFANLQTFFSLDNIMDLQNEINKTSGFKNLELLANKLLKDLFQGCIKVHFMDFLLNLLSIKFIIREKAHAILIGNLYAKQISFLPSDYDEETNLRCHLFWIIAVLCIIPYVINSD